MTWEDLGYPPEMARMKQKRYGAPTKRDVIYAKVSAAFKTVGARRRYNFSRESEWRAYYSDIIAALQVDFPESISKDDIIAIHRHAHPASDKTVIGMDVWDFVTDRIAKRIRDWEFAEAEYEARRAEVIAEHEAQQ